MSVSRMKKIWKIHILLSYLVRSEKLARNIDFLSKQKEHLLRKEIDVMVVLYPIWTDL